MIDEVWVAFRDWINEWDYEVGWKRIRKGEVGPKNWITS